jgi:hypothetical protein
VFARSKSDLPVLLCLALCAIVLATLHDYGLTWDEPVYSLSGHEHFLWFRDVSRSLKRIDGYWQYGKEHPPLGTLVGGFTEDVLCDRHGLVERYTAFRLQALLYVFILNFTLFMWVSECWGRATAFVAALSSFLLPRLFFHAHLGALDYPMTAMWVATAYAFWKGLASPPDGGRASPPRGGRVNPRWMLAASVLLGLALLTKVNALFLWALLLGWFAVWFRSDLWRLLSTAFQKSGWTSERLYVAGGLEGRGRPSKGLQRKDATERSVLERHRGEAPVEDVISQVQSGLRNDVLSAGFRGCFTEHARVARSLAALLLVPPAVFFVGWPWLWPHPFSRTWDYLKGLATHAQFPVYYLGRTWTCPPWHYAFVLTAVTIPLGVLIPLLVGFFRLHRTTNRAAAAFLLLNALVPIAVIAFLSSCVYDGERLWLPAFPFLCALSAVGVREICSLAERIRARAVFVALYGALFAVSVYFSVVRYHPYESSYFNEIVGGVDGSAARGF